MPACPECQYAFTQQYGTRFGGPECANDRPPKTVPATGEAESAARVVRDSFGNELIDGDSAVVIKDLKVKKSSLVVELGAKVRRIGLVDRDQYFNCRTEGIGAMGLNSEFVKHA